MKNEWDTKARAHIVKFGEVTRGIKKTILNTTSQTVQRPSATPTWLVGNWFGVRLPIFNIKFYFQTTSNLLNFLFS